MRYTYFKSTPFENNNKHALSISIKETARVLQDKPKTLKRPTPSTSECGANKLGEPGNHVGVLCKQPRQTRCNNSRNVYTKVQAHRQQLNVPD